MDEDDDVDEDERDPNDRRSSEYTPVELLAEIHIDGLVYSDK